MLVKIINKQVKEIVKNKLLLIIVLSIASVMMFAECLAAQTNTAGMDSTAFNLLIGVVVIFSFTYIFRYLFKLHIDTIAIFNTLGMRNDQILLMFSVVIFISSILIFFAGSILGIGTFAFVKQNVFSAYLRGSSNDFLKIWIRTIVIFSIYLIIALTMNYCKLHKKNTKELFDEKVKMTIKMPNYKLSICLYILSTGLLVICMGGLENGTIMLQIAISGGMVVLLLNIVSFYFVFYGTILKIKSLNFTKKISSLFVYNILTKDIARKIGLSIILSICLVFSFIAYTSGIVFLDSDIMIFSGTFKIYFSVVQMCIAVIILIIYFIVLAMDIVSELNLFKKDINILFLLGYSTKKIDKLLSSIILLKFLIPSLAFWGITLGLFLNIIKGMENLLMQNAMQIIGSFALTYNVLLMAYAVILYREYNCKQSL